MNILNALKQLRDDIKAWVTNNLNTLNAKIDEKTIPIDSELSSTSTNPVQNQAISKEIDSINDRVGDTPVATQISQAINAQEHFSGDYNDLVNAPNISEDSSGNMIIADESGNIIFKADADGVHTTAVSINGEAVATEKYVDDAVANIDIPEVDFTGYATEIFVNDAIANIDFPETDFTGYATEDFVTTTIDSVKEELSESIVAESDEWKVVDEAGNIIFSVDASGAHTTELTLNGENAATESYVDDAIANIEIPEPPEVNYPDIEIVDDTTITAAEENLVNVYKDLTVDETNGHILHEELVTVVKKEYVDEAINNLPEWTKAEEKPTITEWAQDDDHLTVTKDEKDTWNSKSDFSGNYEDLNNAPSIEERENGELIIADPEGNIAFRVSEGGVEVTNIIVDGISVKDKDETLETSAETVVGAINELNSKINEGGTEDVEESMVGTWVFNDEPSLGYLTPTVQYEISFISNGIQYRSIRRQPTGPSSAGIFSIIYEDEDDSKAVYSENPDGLHGITNGWYDRAYKFITITEEPTNETIKTWIKSSTKRYEPIGADRVSSIDTYAGGVFDLGLETDSGLTWRDDFQFFEGVDLGGSQITNGTIYHHVPIAGGNNVTIRIDEDTNLARIDSGEYSLGLEYTFHDFYYNVAGIGNCQDSIIRIPPTHNGYPVTGIEDLKNTPQITEIILPNSIGEIFDYAFDGCQYLTKLYIPRSVYVVGEDICSASEKVTIYCELSEEEISTAHSWSQEWNAQGCPVKWSSPREVFDVVDAIDSRLPVTNFTLRNDTPILDLKALADKAGTTPFIIHSKEGDYTGIWIVQIGNAYSDNYYASFTQLQAGFIFNYSSSKLFNSSSDFVFYDFIQEPQRVLTTYSSELSTEDKNLINVVNGLVADVGNISGALDSIIAQTNTIIGGTE